MSGPGELLAVDELGNVEPIPNTYEAVKQALRGATLSGCRVSQDVMLFVDDNGIINQQLLNVPASLCIGRAIYGPVVLLHGEPDDEGNEQPPPEEAVEQFRAVGERWAMILADMRRLGQPLFDVRADDANLPPPQIIMLDSDEDFLDFLSGKQP